LIAIAWMHGIEAVRMISMETGAHFAIAWVHGRNAVRTIDMECCSLRLWRLSRSGGYIYMALTLAMESEQKLWRWRITVEMG
jgi:hypothetical protein